MELHHFWNLFLNYWHSSIVNDDYCGSLEMMCVTLLSTDAGMLGTSERGRTYWCLFKSRGASGWSCGGSTPQWVLLMNDVLLWTWTKLLSKDWTVDTPLSSRTIMVLRLLEHPSPFFNPRKNAPRSQRSTHRMVLSAIRLDLHILYVERTKI